jgi:2-(1,2-epoxy-1,2-dihydrophenyl)acetyl-CoA isomerase
MAGDVIVAARSATFIQVFSRIALVPDLGSTWLLPRLVGRQRALELMLMNEPLSAELAKEWGLVREVFDDAALRDGALALARKLANGPTRALVATRRLLEESEHASYADQFRREIETQADIRKSADALEGRNAFLEKRAARFSGR